MNAQEMFEKLGYVCTAKTTEYIEISNDNNCINFWLKDKLYDSDEYMISAELHQAITQQMKELGWL